MIFDSTVWIDYLRGVRSLKTNLLDQKLENFGLAEIYICPTIFQEVLQGVKDNKHYNSVKDLLLTTQLLQMDSYFVSEMAAEIYRKLRMEGVTIRKPNDCLIAAYAIHFNMTLVHNDRDFDKISKRTKLKTYST